MGFANKYIENNKGEWFYISPVLCKSYSIVVVIPCYNEPEISLTINSLFFNIYPQTDVIVVVVVNNSQSCNGQIVDLNKKTVFDIENLSSASPKWMLLKCLHANGLPDKNAGVGWARKIGMDWAVSYFNNVDNPNGIIVSLDADSLVDSNYLSEIKSFFTKNTNHQAATIYFEHPLILEMDSEHFKAMVFYELYIRFYKHALSATGFPNAVYTIGSCLAFKAGAYVAQGGMNRRKAGEDFYFLHKISQYGSIGTIGTTCVYPSARISNRVPFGTGPAIASQISNPDNYSLCYPLGAFNVVKSFFSRIDSLFNKKNNIELSDLGTDGDFLGFAQKEGLVEKITELANNCSTVELFAKRFFHLFGALQVLRWLNYASGKNYPKVNLLLETKLLLTLLGYNSETKEDNELILLKTLRGIDKS